MPHDAQESYGKSLECGFTSLFLQTFENNYIPPHPVASLGPSLGKRREVRGREVKAFSEQVSICCYELTIIQAMKGATLRWLSLGPQMPSPSMCLRHSLLTLGL